MRRLKDPTRVIEEARRSSSFVHCFYPQCREEIAQHLASELEELLFLQTFSFF